ncbi:hypothetical protein EDL99_08410 [Ornithobacterium rhinotracheale]|uniref:BACON domain-containing protein n=1 Tax=Ornithobacterium rhinotracheale TaxID=28251 RepID=UPI00129C9F9B|nr:BACON domain-containing protein [Ornithobacterium rhinotracheale]MRJ08885.1 hypothetical protein [Ornithobacterium rhinotracheale]UOH77765.1 BACON domain-containing protein [Ornithobacterium rhinotracheale]
MKKFLLSLSEKRSYFFFLGLVSLISILSSCSHDDGDRTRLETAVQEVSFDYVASQKRVEINSSGDYTVSASEDWFTVGKLWADTNAVQILVKENPLAVEREGVVTLTLGQLSQKILVKQAKAPLKLTILQDNIEATKQGGNFEIQVTSNAQNYSVSTEESWLHLAPNPEEGKVSISVDENTTGEKRTGRISFLVDNQIVKSMEITQEGIATYALPYLLFGATAEQVKAFELERKNNLSRETDISGTGTQMAYGLTDKIFNEVNYLVGLKGLQQASLFAAGGTISEENKASFEEFLINQGFEKQTMKGYESTLAFALTDKPVFINEKTQVRAEFMSDRGQNHYRFTYYPVQQREYATFAEFPYFKKGATKAQVEAYEATQSGTLSSSKSEFNTTNSKGFIRDLLYFEGDAQKTFARTYYVYHPGQTTTGLVQITNYYADHSLALYQGLDGDYYLTKEFIKLAQDNGFNYSSFSTKYGYIFTGENVKLYVRWYKHETFGWTLRISIY